MDKWIIKQPHLDDSPASGTDILVSLLTGFKCNSAVWRALRKINTQHEAWVEDESEKAGSV